MLHGLDDCINQSKEFKIEDLLRNIKYNITFNSKVYTEIENESEFCKLLSFIVSKSFKKKSSNYSYILIYYVEKMYL